MFLKLKVLMAFRYLIYECLKYMLITTYIHIYEIIKSDSINYARFIFNDFYTQCLSNIDSDSVSLWQAINYLFMSLN